MKQFILGAGAALLLASGGVMWWAGQARSDQPIRSDFVAKPVAPFAAEALADPPAATEKTREEKRFSRYDKDKNGAVSREEYLAARRKAFAKLDTNGDGKLAFEEYAVKTGAKFAKADGDRSGILSPTEFAATRVVRKAKARPDCPPAAGPREDD